MRTLDKPVESLKKAQSFRLVKCYKIEREDTSSFYFTEHNQELILADTKTYSPLGGFDASAKENSSALNTQNLEVVGVLNSSYITTEDLRAGLYDNAKITEYLVDWLYPWIGYFKTNVFWITNAFWTGEFWKAEVEGIARKLQPQVGKVFTRTCRHILGDTGCGIALSQWKASKAVTQVDTQRLTFRTDEITLVNGTVCNVDDDLNGGYVEWTSGNNDEMKCDIKDYTAVNQIITLQINTEFDIEIGDTFDVYYGCDKNASTCKSPFDNLLNFGGFPFIPGSDYAYITPKEQ